MLKKKKKKKNEMKVDPWTAENRLMDVWKRLIAGKHDVFCVLSSWLFAAVQLNSLHAFACFCYHRSMWLQNTISYRSVNFYRTCLSICNIEKSISFESKQNKCNVPFHVSPPQQEAVLLS